MILGIDEVGRGPWAGPLVVGAVVLGDAKIKGLTDSKKLSKKRRQELAVEINQKALGMGLGWVSAEEIDEVGLSKALRLATKRAVEQVKAPYHEIIIDGTVNFLSGTSKGKFVTTLKKADLLIASVSAASIVAKVARDDYMTKQDEVYLGYSFASHVGYGTAKHRLAIDELGVTPLHRLSFEPLKKYSKGRSAETFHDQDGFTPGTTRVPTPGRTWVADVLSRKDSQPNYAKLDSSTTKQIGDMAEDMAAEYLQNGGHEVLERNWKTKFCEIDIVSKKAGTIYFVEVKYRKVAKWGDGLDAITKTKLKQMKFASEVYDLYKDLYKFNRRLAVMSLSGEPPTVDKYLELE